MQNRLYTTLDLIGKGGMGAVYRARNRLNGQIVALKQVEANLSADSSEAGLETLALALTREFQALAGLRHPYIISVLDYGFDEGRRPFFVMEYVENGVDLLSYGRTQPTLAQIRLIEQLLEALLYLHRHNILHRDLKPANALVVNGQVKLLDFGLSVLLDKGSVYRSDSLSGTLAYCAPEIFMGQGFSAASDLYAVGIMLHQLLIGRHPFNADDLGQFIQETLNKPPDLAELTADNSPAAPILARLLAKEPQERYKDAAVALADLRRAYDLPPTADAIVIRESYLQSAPFIGRQTELTQLLAALDAAGQGRGGLWLVGGASGAGKSRLLDELRIHALVHGFAAAQGQGTAGGGLPYQLWRDALPRLLLNIPLSDLEIGVLREIVPDIDQLAGRPGDPISPLSGADGRRRLVQTILAVLRRQPQPTLLILEDLQWTQESLAPLQEALAQAHELPLLIVGSYRAAEAPDLPAQLPGAALLTLDPLDRPQIAELSTAVLGRAAADASLLDFLAWSSEGNAFFVIELLRTISEQASQISELSQAGARYAAAGMEQIVQERLERLPSALQALLKLAAVSGRQLDLTLLVELVEIKALDHWLYAALDAGLLEVFAGQWRFAHDKLREGILAGLLPEELTILHEQVAAGLEQAYPDDPGYALTLAQHWQAAEQPEKMTAYAVIAAAQMIQRSSFAEALALLQTALPQTADPLRRARIQYELGNACEGLGKREQAVAYLQESLTAYRQTDDRPGVMQTLNILGQVYSKQGEFIASLEILEEALAIARQLDDQAGLAHALLWLGDGLYMAYEDAAGAAVYLQEALTAARASGDSVLVGRTLNIMGEHRRYLGQYPEAERYYQEALPLYEAIGHVWGIAIINTNMGHIMRLQGRTAVAWEHYRAALRALRQQGMLAASWELLAGAAGLLLLEGNGERAAQILALVHSQPDLDVDARNIAAPITAQVAAQLSAAEMERATAVGQRLDPVQLVTELIA